MKLKKLQQKILVWCFIVVTNLFLIIYHFTYETNKFYDIEDTNAFRWQRYMNEDEFHQLQEGMTYMDVVNIAKGRGEQLTEHTFMWKDEQSLKRTYIITFQEDQLVGKLIYNRHHAN
ncbi:hypothetical protein [Ureibacillus acetophenoni]|uniref:Uncharacterized protein n=1 Tax=Ureibacillus acetophenoni TaxID=614649 RepID=A0A285UP38_9BACL|nr:hypothetical protein [Ureibacillus acetophenoni]SOC43589.1 hypothetical protein SAMN05877842_11664 [Ureibacillus acetophenoni]